MNAIKDQAMPKNKQLLLNIVLHAVEQVNFTIKNLNKRATIGTLMQCEDTLTDLLPVVQMIAVDHIEYAPVYGQMSIALSAAQIGGEPMEIEL
ncbi:hypothetical protein [uncultured Pseudoalteromonas sp.]|uniref:hypothetical protein n=1 Tax=uncultured Pseudoalteromonas sp. TaxID=114053 RepID=UPI002593CF4A|nr:hypothetical protein [uncultured Pseudoalteromonas sp.]